MPPYNFTEEEMAQLDDEELKFLLSQENPATSAQDSSTPSMLSSLPIIGPAADSIYRMATNPNLFNDEARTAEYYQKYGPDGASGLGEILGTEFKSALTQTVPEAASMAAWMLAPELKMLTPVAGLAADYASRYGLDKLGLWDSQAGRGDAGEDYRSLNPLRNPAMQAALPPIAAEGIDALRNTEVGWLRKVMTPLGMNPVSPANRVKAANEIFDVAQSENAIPMAFGNSSVMAKGARGQGIRDPLIDSEGFAQRAGLFEGRRNMVTDPASPEFGKMAPLGEGELPLTKGTEVHSALQRDLPIIREQRDVAISAYDTAWKQAQQGSGKIEMPIVSGESLRQSPVDLRLPDGRVAKVPLEEALQAQISAYRASGVSNSVVQGMEAGLKAIPERGLAVNASPAKIQQNISIIDDKIKALGGYDSGTPEFEFATGQIETLRKVRTAWSDELNRLLGGMSEVFKDKGLPTSDLVARANETIHNLIPWESSLGKFKLERDIAASTLMPGAQRPTLNADQNPLNMMNSGSAASISSRVLGDVVNSPAAAATEKMALIGDQNNAALSTAQEIFRLRSQGAPDKVPMPGAVTRTLERGSPLLAATNPGMVDLPSLIEDARAQMPERSPIQQPSMLQIDMSPPAPVQREGFVIPRNIDNTDPQGISNLIVGYVEPERVMPLLGQFKRVVASGDKKQVAQFLGALSEQYPDLPFATGAVTGLPSEFDIGDGKTRLFSPLDMAKWEEQIDKSPLREDEKAQRVMALRKDGVVIPFSQKVITFGSQPAGEASSRPMEYLKRTYQFNNRTPSPFGSQRAE